MAQHKHAYYDVIVVGAGNAALCAALAAHDAGAHVVVLEKAPHEERGGNSRFSGGGFRFAYDNIEDLKPLMPHKPAEDWERTEVGSYPPERFRGDIMRVTEGRADPVLTDVLVNNSYDTATWMHRQGVTWDWTFLQRIEVEGKVRYNTGLVLQAEEKGVGLMEMLFASVEKKGIEIVYQAKLAGLLVDDQGQVLGVKVRYPSGTAEIRSGAVMLACGGFQANAEMRAKYLGGAWDIVKVRGTRFDTGEGLQIAMDIGAKPVGHWRGCHATPIDADAPPVGVLHLTDLTNRLSYPFSIMVDKNGKRFADEGEDLNLYTYAKFGGVILQQPGGVAFQIFDQKVVHLLEERYSTGTPRTGNTIAEVAEKIGVNPATLTRTVEEYNAAVQPGKFNPQAKDGKRTEGIEPPKSNWALPLDTPPYLCYPVTGGITFTFGGIKIDTEARVINNEDEVIPRLYATGEIIGELFYYNYPGGSGLMLGSVFGRIGGVNVAREALALRGGAPARSG